MRMDDPYPTFTYFVTQIRQLYPRFAYIHLFEPRVLGGQDRVPLPGESNDFLRKIWDVPESRENGSVFISAGGYNRQLAFDAAEEKGDLISFGRHFIPNVSFSEAIDIPWPLKSKSCLARSPSPHFQGHTINTIRPLDILHQD